MHPISFRIERVGRIKKSKFVCCTHFFNHERKSRQTYMKNSDFPNAYEEFFFFIQLGAFQIEMHPLNLSDLS